jgi:hypothetical protein
MGITRKAKRRHTAFLAALLAASAGANVPGQSAEQPTELIKELTHQTPERANPGYVGCGEDTSDRLVARRLAQMRQAAVPALEEALASIERGGQRSPFARGAFWVLASYAKIEGPAGDSRLRRMAADPKLAFLSLGLDSAIALEQSITSHVSESQTLANVLDCIRPQEPRDAVNQLILAWERGDRRWFEASLGPQAKDSLKALLKGKTWGKMRAELWSNRPSGSVALGYRFNGAGRWGEPRETLDIDREYPLGNIGPQNPRIETLFKTSSGGDCGKVWVEFVLPPTGEWGPELAYLVDNSDLSGLLRTITSCATPSN